MSFDASKILWKNRRVKTPTILQMEATECGAASLAMIFAHYKLFVPLEKLRIECDVSRDGSNAAFVAKAARRFGFEAKGFRVEPEELQALELPLIIFWSFNHFLVLEGYKRGTYYLNDPACGPRCVDEEEFNRNFTGIALQIVPGPEFKPGGVRASTLKQLLSWMKNGKRGLLYLFLISGLMAIPGMVMPSLLRIFVDEVLGPNPSWLGPLLLAVAVTAMITAYMTWLQQMAIMRLGAMFSISAASRLMHHLLRLPIDFFYQRQPGELNYRMSLVQTVSRMLSGQIAVNIVNLFMVVFYLVLLFQYDSPLALVGAGIAALNFLLLFMINKKRMVLNQELMQEQSKLVGVSMNGIQLMETIKATSTDFDFFARWAGHQAKSMNAEQRMSRSSILLGMVPSTLSAVNNSAILVFGAYRVMTGHMSMGMLVAFQSLMAAFLAPVGALMSMSSEIQQAKGAVDKLEDALCYERDPTFAEGMEQELDAGASLLSGELTLRDVTFGYSRQKPPLIDGFSLQMNPGARVALVGRSGSGKSTVAKLVAGLYQPWSGELLLDGAPRLAHSRQRLENSVSIVDQDIQLFQGTIRDNLTMWNPLVEDEDLVRALKDAEVYQEVAGRLGGLGADMVEEGRNFSGGQRQRLEIARALVSNPSLLVMDEATSALDPETEKKIVDNVQRRGCTCLIVAHRLSTVRDCDEILVMEKGQVVERGAHEELAQHTDGAYYQLISMD